MSKILDFLATPFKGILDGAKGIIDTVVTNKEEAILANAKLQEVVNKQKELIVNAYNSEMANARNREIEINNSANASWLSKNVSAIIALLICLASFTLLLCIYFGFGNSHETVQSQISQGVFSLITMVLGYYFGSSHQRKNLE